LQDTIALSMIEAEYMATVEASKKIYGLEDWLRYLVSYRIQFGLIATARVRFILLRITGITSGRSTLM